MDIKRDPIDVYGTPEHEMYLLELEAREDRDGVWNDPGQVGGCGCVVSQVYGGDCAHTLAGEDLA